jgi:succinate dehydrogenase / fumarate reductase, membrane anchor subunit
MATAAQPLKSKINSFETFMYRYMRWSGVLLIPLAFGHLLIVHIINSVYVIDYEWVINTRWSFVWWRLYDAFLLWFAGLHGFNGLRVVINDYVHNPSTNRMLKMVLFGLLILIFALGTATLLLAPHEPVPLPESALVVLFA